jgi:hypothetical protein
MYVHASDAVSLLIFMIIMKKPLDTFRTFPYSQGTYLCFNARRLLGK